MNVAYLLSGDGDSVNLVDEVARSDEKICLGAFSPALDPRLVSAVDRFFLLDDVYFEASSAAEASAQPA